MLHYSASGKYLVAEAWEAGESVPKIVAVCIDSEWAKRMSSMLNRDTKEHSKEGE